MSDGRNIRVSLRVSEATRDRIQELADEEGVTLSTWCDKHLVAAVLRYRQQDVPQKPEQHESAGTV